MGKHYKISEEKLIYLVNRDNELLTLEINGVDNWEGYGESADCEDEDTPTTEEYIELTFEVVEEEN